jgi:hypothetical protein
VCRRTERGDDGFATLFEIDRDALASPHLESGQGTGEATNLQAQFAVREDGVTVVKGSSAGIAFR